MAIMLRTLGLIAGILFSVSAMAAALVESVTGVVRAGPSAAAVNAVTVGQRIDSGTTVVTGAKSQVILRFDDGQVMILNDDTEFRIADYAFSEKEPAKDRFVFDLLRGAARSVTALLTRRSANAYALRVPQATIGIRGTDYMVAVYNPAVVSVISGITTVSNAAGLVAVQAGGLVSVATGSTLAAATTMGALPAGVASSFSSLSSVAVTAGSAAAGTGAGAGSGAGAGAGSSAGAAGAGAGAAGSAAVGGLSAGTVAVGAAAAAAIAGAISSPTTATATVSTTTSTAP